MLVSSQLSQVPTVDRLVSLWADRYLPNLATLPLSEDASVRHQLRIAASANGRAQTVTKLDSELVEEKCRLAAIRVKDTYEHLPEACGVKEVIRLAQLASPIYLKLLEVYQVSPAVETTSKADLWAIFGESALASWGIPKIDNLADTLEPLLLQFQKQHLIAKDWRTLGFITTEINFSNGLLLDQLTVVEQILIKSYLDFLEEQVALPWQRMCAAAAKYDLTAPVFLVIEQMLPQVSAISMATYQRLRQAFPIYYSRRGLLSNPAIQHSCLRDMSMFQAYLWLAVLQGNLKVIEQELLALCIVVLERVGVSWSMTIMGTEFLMDEILKHLDADQQRLVRPYAEGMIQAFRHQSQ